MMTTLFAVASLPSICCILIQGERFRRELRGLSSPIVQQVRGKGLLNAVVIEDRSTDQSYAWDVCVRLADMGTLLFALLCCFSLLCVRC